MRTDYNLRSFLFSSFLFFSPALFSQVIFVNASVTGGNQDGTSWPNAFSDLQQALTIAQTGNEIWVAQGTYFPTSGTDRQFSFEIQNGFKLYGGFTGVESSINERDWELNETILSGDIGIVGDSTDNSFSVVYMEYVDSTTMLDGFIVTKGEANYTLNQASSVDHTRSGGGLYIEGSGSMSETNPWISNCSFKSNYASALGGGVFVNGLFNGDISPVFINCTFDGNKSSAKGAGLYITGGSFFHDFIIDQCYFGNNKSGSATGLNIKLTHGTNNIYVSNCLFSNNINGASGAGIDIEDLNNDAEKTLFIRNCRFENNHATQGAAIDYTGFSEKGRIVVDSSQFIQNSAIDGILTSTGDNPIIISNSVFQENETDEGCIFAIGTTIEATNCLFYENYGTVIGILALVPGQQSLLTNCIFYKNHSDTNPFSSFQGMMYCEVLGYTASLNIYNSIFYENELIVPSQELIILNGFEATFSNCLVSLPNCQSISNGVVNCNTGMIYEQDPLFTDPENNDFTLNACSPARNAGSNAIIDSLNMLTDLAGNTRIMEGIVDLGAYETPEFSIDTFFIVQPSCGGAPSAEIAFELSNGCEPYDFVWNNSITTGNGTSGFSPGSYDFTITDAAGRQVLVTAGISYAPSFSLNQSSVQFNCTDYSGGAASTSPVGGTAPFSYSWNTGDTISGITGLLPGNYEATVTDGAGCTETATFEIGTTGHLLLSIDISPITCNNSDDGVATISPLNGTLPFTFNWSNGEDSATLDSLTGGDYSIIVTDSLGCSDELSFYLPAPLSIEVSFVFEDSICSGANNGNISAEVTGGTMPYEYLWNTGGATSVISALPPEKYYLSVVDINGCTMSDSVEIFEFPPIELNLEVMDVRCPDSEPGWASSTPSGSTPPYTFQWSTSSIDSIITGLNAGNYGVTVLDANQCVFSDSFSVMPPNYFSPVITIMNATSSTAPDGFIHIDSLVGGTPPFTFLWSTGDTTASVDQISAGEYFVTITDAEGCFKIEQITISFDTGIEENSPKSWLLMPNPVKINDEVFVQLPGVKEGWLQLYDYKGQTVFNKRLRPGNDYFQFSSPPISGIYVVIFESSKGELKAWKLMVY